VSHHATRVRVATNRWEIARPLRDSSRWHRWRHERACGKASGHCWHSGEFLGWWCCLCSADCGGIPPQRCRYCLAAKR
jgi:hypothetical protein